MTLKKILHVFDFDETIVRVPSYTDKKSVEGNGLTFNHPYDFYDHPVSLSEIVYNIQLIEPVHLAWLKGSIDPEVESILVTHRVEALEKQVLEILSNRNMKFDQTFFLGRKSSKADVLEKVLKEMPSIEEIWIYEDSIQQIAIYQEFIEAKNRQRDTAELPDYSYRTFIVDKSAVFQITDVKISDKRKIRLV